MAEKGYTYPFWRENGIVPDPDLKNFIESVMKTKISN